MSEQTVKPGFWAVLPAPIRYDEVIPPNAKLLYAELSSLAQKTGYCYAPDSYFQEVFGFSARSVRRLLDTLQDAGYIRIETVRGLNNAIEERKIYAGLNPLFEANSVLPKMAKPKQKDGPVLPKLSAGSAKIVQTIQYKEQEIITEPPISPPRGNERGKAVPELKVEPEWKPDRFAALRKYYPKGYCKHKQAEIRAWDKLHLSDAEIDEMARGLKRMKEDPEWKRGIGIPHLSTFLNQRRWMDAAEYRTKEEPAPPAPAEQNGGYELWT